MSNFIQHVHASFAGRPAFREGAIDASSSIGNKRNARTQEDRLHVESDFVNEIRREQRAREVTASENTDILSGASLQLLDELGGIVFYERDALLVDGVE